ncbi:Lipoamide acyltransferase component of branched-chain alpha-keto acid dehydrogenase complex [Geodia barretti]|uniref:Dihydrolipoamide acetyltransferase component of pyruvate dehydrogenase complex n=1 Tax=Geodia barretti TaxID=519541 RepID=A0AA35W367_GEOBA|nr:Lipoamide acyltransferase component of branched-chain alpha-keto acid dehydrogenase complex [Geodia barretti]
MAITIELPHVGESVVEGTIGKWLKQPGDSVRRYEPLVEVITDKVTMEVPSPVEGELLRVLAAEGETLPMGAPIAEVGDPGETPSTDTPAATHASAPAATTAPAASVDTTGYLMRNITPVGPTGGAAVEVAEPMVGVGVQHAPPAAPAIPAPVPAASPVAPAQVAPSPRDGSLRLSPAVRRLAREHSVELGLIQGTGMGGRITRDDVLRFLAEPHPAPASALAAAQTTPLASDRTPAPAVAGPDEERVPLTPVRRMIAEAMVRSVTEIPHAWSVKEVDVTGLVALRQSVRSGFDQQEGVSLTFMPFVIRAVVEALRQVPTMNATWGGDSIVLKRRINLGLAVAAPNGLIVPVIHNADRLTISGLAHAVADITERARSNRLALDDVQGGTFTLNNTGALGGSLVSGPIINYPQAGIMTTESIEKRPVVRDDAIAIRSMMNICLAFDHRINDGAEASGFLEAVKARLESFGPDSSIY